MQKEKSGVPKNTIAVLSLIIAVIILMSFNLKNEPARIQPPANSNKDSVESVKAFLEVYKVFTKVA